MANEAVIVELLGNPKGEPIRYTCADGIGIEKGAVLYLLDPRTASGAVVAGNGTACAGIASMEKVAGDGSTTISCWTNGIFDMTFSGACALGHPVGLGGGGGNTVAAVNGVASGAAVLGYALETASNAEVALVRVRVGGS